jgi:hypothetical protein
VADYARGIKACADNEGFGFVEGGFERVNFCVKPMSE